jgi:hypothetical protein
MIVERFFGDIPLSRLRDDLVGREVIVEFYLIDALAERQAIAQERYIERYPSREPVREEIREYVAMHFTPFLRVWNRDDGSAPPSSAKPIQTTLDRAIRVCSLETRILGLRSYTIPSDQGPSLQMVELEVSSAAALSFPIGQVDEETPGMTVAVHPVTQRREYMIRFFGAALVISLPA